MNYSCKYNLPTIKSFNKQKLGNFVYFDKVNESQTLLKARKLLYEICMTVIDVSWFYGSLITFRMHYPEITAEFLCFSAP